LSEKNGKLERIYYNKIYNYLKKDIDYKIDWHTIYEFDVESGIMLSCQNKIEEKANDAYVHTTEYKITRQKEHKKENE